MADNDRNGPVTWKALEEGCSYGRLMVYRVDQLENRLEKQTQAIERSDAKVDRLTWAAAALALSFGVSALFLALNLLL